MRDKQNDFKKAEVQVVLVGMGAPKESKAFLKHFLVPFSIICDPGRKLYGAYGLKRMGILDFLSPPLAFKSLSEMVKGNMAGMPEGDVKQLSGVFVIDTSGDVRFRHLSADPADFPTAGDILTALESISYRTVC